MGRLAALLGALSVSLALAASASATTVTKTPSTLDETETFYACSFPLTIHFFNDNGFVIEIDRNGTTQLLFLSGGPTTATITNPANGKTLVGMGQTAGELIKISDESFVDHLNGITFNFVIPGEGGVFQWIGVIFFSKNTGHGLYTLDDTTALCDYLADP
jgi:hypothetical protein